MGALVRRESGVTHAPDSLRRVGMECASAISAIFFTSAPRRTTSHCTSPPITIVRSRPASIARVDELATEVRLLHLYIPDLVDRAGENVPVEDDQVGQLTLLERAFFLLFEHQI